MDKNILRTEARRHRNRIDPASENPEECLSAFMDAIPFQSGQILAGYWPISSEIDPRGLMDEAAKAGLILALPVIKENEHLLRFCEWQDGQPLEKGPFDIMQPVEKVEVIPDIILVPMLAFDRHGYRLGYGGGYYDATIEEMKRVKSVICIGFAYAQQAVLFNLPHEPHDQPMGWILTPKGITKFGKGRLSA